MQNFLEKNIKSNSTKFYKHFWALQKNCSFASGILIVQQDQMKDMGPFFCSSFLLDTHNSFFDRKSLFKMSQIQKSIEEIDMCEVKSK